MTVDAYANFAYSTVATPPSPATSGTSLVVASGEGAGFPAVPFNAVVCPVGTQPTAANAEIVRVTARSGDTLGTIVRTQEGSAARTIVAGDQIFQGVTSRTISDLSTYIPLRGTEAARPAASTLLANALYEATDSGVTYFCTGAAWVLWDPGDGTLMWNGGVLMRETLERDEITSQTLGMALTGVMYVVGVKCYRGDVLTNIGVRWGTTGQASPTNWWFALYDPSLNLIGQTPDQTTTAIAASSFTRFAMTGGPYTMAATGIHYACIMVASAAQPTLIGKSLVVTGAAGGFVTGQKKIVGTSVATGFTTTAPGTVAISTSTPGIPYIVLD